MSPPLDPATISTQNLQIAPGTVSLAGAVAGVRYSSISIICDPAL
jgi:hypothetical protein